MKGFTIHALPRAKDTSSPLPAGEALHRAIAGTTARGSRDQDTPAAHLVAASAPDVHATVAQLRVNATTKEHKAALELLGVLPIEGKIITGDAMFTHRDVGAKILEGGGDYILPVKDNQPTRRANIQAVWAEPASGLSPLPVARRESEIERASETDKGHGRVEQRTIEVTSALAEYLQSAWSGGAPVFRLTRQRRIGAKTELEVVFEITSLACPQAGPRR